MMEAKKQDVSERIETFVRQKFFESIEENSVEEICANLTTEDNDKLLAALSCLGRFCETGGRF